MPKWNVVITPAYSAGETITQITCTVQEAAEALERDQKKATAMILCLEKSVLKQKT